MMSVLYEMVCPPLTASILLLKLSSLCTQEWKIHELERQQKERNMTLWQWWALHMVRQQGIWMTGFSLYLYLHIWGAHIAPCHLPAELPLSSYLWTCPNSSLQWMYYSKNVLNQPLIPKISVPNSIMNFPG